MQTPVAQNPEQQRRRELAQIHIAVQQLHMSEDDHRALLMTVCQVSSAAALDSQGRRRYLDHLKKIGFKPRAPVARAAQPRRPARAPAAPAASRSLAQDGESRKIRALWLQLHALGAVRNPSEASLGVYVHRITGVQALQWVSPEQAQTLIETLKKWAMRLLPAAVEQLARQVGADIGAGRLVLPLEETDRLRRLVARAQAQPAYDPMQQAWEALASAIQSAAANEG